ncbi:sulfatase-like hydrolase/transferase [Pirellulaceae bacterium SH467]
MRSSVYLSLQLRVPYSSILRSLLGGIALCLGVGMAPQLSMAAERPNVIVVLIDDMGWADLSCFGGKRPETEHIDRLAKEGMKFTQFYVNSPICSPSRVALATGQYPHRWRITSYLNNRKSNEERGVAQWLDPAAPMLARELQRSGYATGHFGKWHMGGQRDVDNAPSIQAYGFDRSLTNFEGMGAKLLPLTMRPEWTEPKRIWEDAERLGAPVTWMQRSEITGGFVQGAIQFIDESVAAQKPFYINLWPDDVHSPFFPPIAKWGNNKRALYRSVLNSMDEQLGVLFNYVRDHASLRNNTLILLCSDNGPEFGAGTCEPFRGAKTWLYEGGVRSPLLVWGPGFLEPKTVGTTNEQSVLCALDINRSLYSFCNVPLPSGTTLDGEDLAGTLLGKERGARQAPIFWRRPPDRTGFSAGFQEDNPDLSVRRGKWKYYVNYDGSDPQLYDLEADVSEKENRANSEPSVVSELHRLVMQWNESMPQDAGNSKP